MKSLSTKQDSILRYVRHFCQANHYPPTVREIQDHCKITSTSVVDYNLKALEGKGYLRRNPKISRGLELTSKATEASERADVVSIPLVGQIAAGQPLPVPDDLTGGEFAESVDVSSLLVGSRRDGLFALKVKGYSMVDALINDGDIVVLRQAETCENGETVAVWLKSEREVTLKKFYREGERVRLQPANVTMDPIYCEAGNVAIQGKLVSVLRTVQ